MMDLKDFRKNAHELVDWMADYLESVENYPVKSQAKPGEIFNQLPDDAPINGEAMEQIIDDFKQIIMPGITHWQSPNFFAYFPANSSYPSILGEMLTATLAAQCMIWDTSPAAAELEEKVMNWLKNMTGLPEQFEGVIQDSASSATLVALLSAREKYSDFSINETGFSGLGKFRIYCSTETHSSIEKAVKIAGYGKNNLVKIAVDDQLRLDPEELEKALKTDISQGRKPVCVIATLGTTGTTAIDPLEKIAGICTKYNIWLHVDAAFAGSALVLPEYRWMIEGISGVDSFVFNPHKWMFTNFDCSAYFVKDREVLIRTLTILPEYLKTKTQGKVNDYRDWGVPLGRRFRALKLWFVLRSYGVKAIQQRIREHIGYAVDLAAQIEKHPDFEMTAPRTLNLVCFRYHPQSVDNPGKLDALNEQLLHRLNDSGKIFLTHTKVNGIYTLRMVTGQTYLEKSHVEKAWKLIRELAGQ